MDRSSRGIQFDNFPSYRGRARKEKADLAVFAPFPPPSYSTRRSSANMESLINSFWHTGGFEIMHPLCISSQHSVTPWSYKRNPLPYVSKHPVKPFRAPESMRKWRWWGTEEGRRWEEINWNRIHCNSDPSFLPLNWLPRSILLLRPTAIPDAETHNVMVILRSYLIAMKSRASPPDDVAKLSADFGTFYHLHKHSSIEIILRRSHFQDKHWLPHFSASSIDTRAVFSAFLFSVSVLLLLPLLWHCGQPEKVNKSSLCPARWCRSASRFGKNRDPTKMPKSPSTWSYIFSSFINSILLLFLYYCKDCT